MEQHKISFQYDGRYFKSGNIDTETKEVWFVLHGYGQLAKYFLRKFSVLPDHKICVIAPEGLSRFYLANFEAGTGRANDRVGATWMTKENRLMDIENYLKFLNAVYEKEVKDAKIPVTILGFSQGSATATRWALNSLLNFKRLILWSGIFPPDMNFESGKDILRNKEVVWVYGDKDPLLSTETVTEMNSLASRLSTNVEEMVFSGGHDIDEETLLKLTPTQAT